MKVSLNWLKDYVKFDLSDRDYAELMTGTGTKVETIERLGEDIENVVAGRINSVTPHPDSDHLVICIVDVGGEKPLQIVTGAQNVNAGDLVPVCLNGAKLPGGKVIKTGKLRGVVSEGMLCSLSELGLTVHDFPYAIEDGIFIMQEPCRLGDDIRDVLRLRDTVVDFELTFNRPDCLALLGIARETAASAGVPLEYSAPEVHTAGDGDDISNYLSVTVKEPALCPRYTARAVKNVRIEPSPLWMRARLRACGIRPINNIVDITNYVMLEYGQPMHAFDASYISSKSIVVRRAAEGERITTLDGNVRELTTDMLCIADGEKPVALAGIMGGENSEITDKTATVILESANFSRSSIRRTSRAVGLRTDASRRYEKGIPPCTTMSAIDRACELITQLGAGTIIDGTIDVCNADVDSRTVDFDYKKINALLGIELSEAEMRALLEKLFFRFDGDGRMIVPPYRGDIINTADIAEEVARFFGYNNLPVTLMRGQTTRGGLNTKQKAEVLATSTCRRLGYSEIMTYSFISPTYYDKIRMPKDSSLRNSLKILNPLGEDTSIMRTTILPSMLEIIARNHSYRNKAARLYELGKIYLPREDGLADEPKYLSLGAYGDGVDFFSFKGSIETLLHELRITDVKYVACTDNDSYHPGRCAKVYAGETYLGVFGQIHPLVAANYGMDTEVYTAELSFDAMYEKRGDIPVYQPLPKFPAVTRDIAVVCDEAVTVGALEESIRRGAKGLLKDVSLFDIYRGPGVAIGKKSVAFNLVLRADDRSLTGEEADEDVQSILAALKADHNAVLR